MADFTVVIISILILAGIGAGFCYMALRKDYGSDNYDIFTPDRF